MSRQVCRGDGAEGRRHHLEGVLDFLTLSWIEIGPRVARYEEALASRLLCRNRREQ